MMVFLYPSIAFAKMSTMIPELFTSCGTQVNKHQAKLQSEWMSGLITVLVATAVAAAAAVVG